MNIQPDFEELLQLLEEHHVDYMIIGGYAVAFHGHPRFTKALDLLFNGSPENITKLRQVLIQFGFTEKDIPEEVFKKKGNIITFGVAPVRVDLINTIDGVTYSEAHLNRIRGKYGTVEVNIIGLDDLLKNKHSTTRARDLADVEELSEV